MKDNWNINGKAFKPFRSHLQSKIKKATKEDNLCSTHLIVFFVTYSKQTLVYIQLYMPPALPAAKVLDAFADCQRQNQTAKTGKGKRRNLPSISPKMTIICERGTELLPGLIFSKINFFIFRDMVKSLKYDVFTIIISNFD